MAKRRKQQPDKVVQSPDDSGGGPSLRGVQQVFHEVLGYEHTPEGMAPLDMCLVVCHALGYMLVNYSFDAPLGLIAGPGGSGKTELLRAFEGYEHVKKFDSITGKGLVSGAVTPEGEDPSGLAEVNRKILMLPDLTNMLNNSGEALSSLLGQLGRTYDADGYAALSGTAGPRNYPDVRFGNLWADTGKFEDYHQALQPIGSRVLVVWMAPPPRRYEDEIEDTSRACAGEEDRPVWQAHLQSTVTELLEDADRRRGSATRPPVTLTERQQRDISRMAVVVTKLRTVPFREDVANAESPKRMAKQLTASVRLRAFLDRRSKVDDTDMAFARVVARHTLPRRLYRMARALWLGDLIKEEGKSATKHTPWVSRKEWVRRAFVEDGPRSPFRLMLRQWQHIGILLESKKKGFRFTPDFHRQLTRSGLCDPEAPGPDSPVHATEKPQ